jgi:branched-chain amino acid transport system ATP-binding protein
LSGLLASDAGRVLFEGRDLGGLGADQRVHAGLARSFQITRLFRSFTALDNVALAVQARRPRPWDFWRPVADDAALRDEALALLTRVGLQDRADALAQTLSHGEQRVLEVAVALATSPRLLLLDEPMAGTGPQESARMFELIRTLKGSIAILLVEHDMDAVFRLADRITVLVNGAVVATGAPESIRKDPRVIAAYLGEEWAP